MRLVPLGDKIIVKRLEAETQTTGGILLPDAARQKPLEGRVLSIGDGRVLADGSRAHHQVNEGDRIVFPSYAGTEVAVDGDELLILREEEILAVLD